MTFADICTTEFRRDGEEFRDVMAEFERHAKRLDSGLYHARPNLGRVTSDESRRRGGTSFYEDGHTNELFLSYMSGYMLMRGIAVRAANRRGVTPAAGEGGTT